MNQAVRSVKKFMYENITSKRPKTFAALLGMIEEGELAWRAGLTSEEECVPLLVADKDKTACVFHMALKGEHPEFIGACLKLRRADASLNDAVDCTAGPNITDFIGMPDKPCKVKGSGLPHYNAIFAAALDAYLQGLTPEGHLLQATDSEQVQRSMSVSSKITL